MDSLSDVLTLVRPNNYGFRGLDAAGDWALNFASAIGIRCFAIETGGCWLRLAGISPPMRLEAGDVVLLTGVEQVQLYSGEAAAPLDAEVFLSGVAAGHVATLNGGGGRRGIGGFFGLEGEHVEAMLCALPPVVHVHSDANKTALYIGVRRLMSELSEPRPGGTLLASHLAQALLIEALRAHLESGSIHRGWLAALTVPGLRRALTAMHADVTRPWTLRALAEAAGMSRSSFAAHFEQSHWRYAYRIPHALAHDAGSQPAGLYGHVVKRSSGIGRLRV